MSAVFDQAETTWVYNYPEQTAELYTTDRRLWLRALSRNPSFKQAQELEPGYLAVWPIREIRTGDMVVSPKPGGPEAARRFMTPKEIALREATGERLRASQGKKGENRP